VIRLPAWLMIIIWFATQLLNGLGSVTDAAQMTGGIAYGAHIGGFLIGLILTLIFRRPDRPPRYATFDRSYQRR
jgi:membrane associated rhomboid family serine protease